MKNGQFKKEKTQKDRQAQAEEAAQSLAS